MGFRSNIIVVLITFLFSGTCLFGCISLRFFKGVEGREVPAPGDELQVGKTTIGQALSQLGAPDRLAELQGKDLLLYQRAVVRQNKLSFSIAMADVWGGNIDLSGYGTLVRYDTLALFFTPDGILQDMVFEKDSSLPYLKTLF